MSTEAVLQQIVDKLNVLENKIDSLDARFDTLETRFSALEIRFGTLETRVEAIFEQTAVLTEFKIETEVALARINETIENKYDLILRDIELVAGEQGKQRIDIARLKAVTGER